MNIVEAKLKPEGLGKTFSEAVTLLSYKGLDEHGPHIVVVLCYGMEDKP